MKKLIIIILSIIIVVTAIITAVIIYNFNNKESVNNESSIVKIADEDIFDDCTDEYEEMQKEMLQANSNEEKISPNCIVTLNVIYKKCGHQKSEEVQIPKELVNKTKKELQEKYSDHKIQSFSDTKIVLIKEEEGECNEHYLVQEKDGKVVIYQIINDLKKELDETDISTEFLSNGDKKQLENGIRINGKKELNKLIENFE